MIVLIPMSGKGSRFAEKGYNLPKPLINVNDKPMIQVVVDNLQIKAHYVFLVLKEHYDKFSLNYILPLICGNNKCTIIQVDSVTEGAACTALLAKNIINVDEPLLIANSDQWVDWNANHFFEYVNRKNADGAILTFFASHPKWSFAKVNEETSIITEVAEKNPISNIATCGIYYFKSGKSFVEGAELMISKNIRTNNEFYICPVFNELINNGYKIYNYPVPELLGLGTPEDLEKNLDKIK